MMNDGKIVGTIIALATDISAKYESIGILSQVFIEPNIFRSTLKDGTVIDIPIENFRNYSIADQAKVRKLITNGLGDLYLSNDGTYKKPPTGNVLNYNKPIIITSTDWRQDGGLESYSLIVNHNLNTENIVPALWNSSNKLETIGMERLNDKQVRLESTQPLSGVLVLNYSTTDASDSLNNIVTIKTEYSFDTMADLNTYFTNTPNALENRLIVGVGTNPVKILMWTGTTSPSSYTESTDLVLWSDQTALIGIKGDMGVQGERGYSDYELAKQNGFVGDLSAWLESLDSCLGEFESLLALKTKYPPVATGFPSGVNSHKFAIIVDINGTGIVSIAFYDNVTTHDWATTKLNQSIPVGTSGENIGFSGTTSARLNLLTNADWNTKEFLYLDTDLHCLMCYKPSVLQFVQYDGQIIGTNPPTITPTNGQVWVGTERVYIYDSTNKFWKIVLYDYVRKYDFAQSTQYSEMLNGADINFSYNSGQCSIQVFQRENADKIHYSVDDSQASALLDTMESVIILNSMIDGKIYNIAITLKFNGVQHSYQLVKYDNVLFVINNTHVVEASSAYLTMSTFERHLFKKNGISSTKIIYDVDLECLVLWNGTSYISFAGQQEKGSFPAIGTEGQEVIGTSGIKYTYNTALDLWYSNFNATKDNAGLMSPSDKDKLDKLSAPPKNNMTATTTPTTTDDTSKGYSEGSIWVYNSTTYTCTDSTLNSAKWTSSADIFYTDTWSSLVSMVNVAGTTYVGKYITVTNANGGASSGATYIAPSAVTNPIVDGGQATYLINSQGSAFSVTCLRRTITNPVIAEVRLTSIAKPSNAGYYIFAVIPSDGLPNGCSVNDICYYDGSTWGKFQSYTTASSVITVGSTLATQTSWRKFQGTWMNTADEYIPDGNEYQTGKTFNGKPVFRKCKAGTTTTDRNTLKGIGLTIPMSGTLLIIQAVIQRSDKWWFQSGAPTGTNSIEFNVSETGVVSWYSNADPAGLNYYQKPYTCWVEYTKS